MSAGGIRRSALLALLAVVAAAAPAVGADALALCASGQPYRWPANGADIPFNPDQGNLNDGPPLIDNPTGVALVQQSFDNWTGLGANVSYLNAGPLPEDVDGSNFGPYLSPVAPDGLSAIVFDANGEIFDTLFGPGSGILGFAGPEWLAPPTCEILEGVSFLNGPAFTDLIAAEDVMTHEFGHYSNLGHVELNGQLVAFGEGGDDSGPSPDDTTFGTPSFLGTEVVETMYPFYFGPDFGTRTPHADDVASMATLYPDATFFTSTGSISGAILAPDGVTRVSGVNVIARNVADPFVDSVSTFSGAYTDSTDPADPNVGVYTLNNLTPGATYAVFIDAVTAAPGRFSNPVAVLFGPEEWHDDMEANSNPPDDPQASRTDVTVAAGAEESGVDVIFNQPLPGEPLQVGDDGFVQIALPFTFCVKGEPFGAVFINANGNVTFGAPDAEFSESAAGFLTGPARVAAVWDDLSPFNLTTGDPQGTVSYEQSASTFTVSWDDVPEFENEGANSFSISLRENTWKCQPFDWDGWEWDPNERTFFGADVKVEYGDLSATDGLAGLSGGIAVTSGAERESNLSALRRGNVATHRTAARYELFDELDAGDTNDLANRTLRYYWVGRGFRDRFEHNDTLDEARRVRVPFRTVNTWRAFSTIDPPAGDVDFYELRRELEEETTLVATIVQSQADTVMGLWFCPDDGAEPSDYWHFGRWWWWHWLNRQRCHADTAEQVAFNDDANGLLSEIVFPVDRAGTYALGVTFCCDFDFDGVDPGQGGALDGGRYVVEAEVIDGVLLDLGDDASANVELGFDFPFDGADYGDIWVNSNGNITLGTEDPFGFVESVPDFEFGPPRIAPLWDDLSPNNGGFVYYKEEADAVTVTYQGVPEFASVGANTFAVTLDSLGGIDVEYGAVSALDGLAGVAVGGGAEATAVDLSATGGGDVDDSPFELFDGSLTVFDLPPGTILTFLP